MSPAEARYAMDAAKVARPNMTGITLDSLLHSNLEARAKSALLRPADGQPVTYAELDRRVNALVGLFASVEPPAGAPVVIAAPLGPEAVIAVMASLRAGLSPHTVPASATADDAEAVMTGREAPIAIGISELAELRPLLALRSAAARSYHLRLLAGFGAHLPDGVAPIDGLPDAEPPASQTRCALSFALPDAAQNRMDCTEADIMALALDIAREARPAPASRIVSTMSGIDATTLASSIGFGLIAGIEVTTLGLFHLAKLWGCLTSSMAVHLVAPASIEAALHDAGITRHGSLATLILIHEAGLSAPAAPLQNHLPPTEAGAPIIDVWRGNNGSYAALRRISV